MEPWVIATVVLFAVFGIAVLAFFFRERLFALVSAPARARAAREEALATAHAQREDAVAAGYLRPDGKPRCRAGLVPGEEAVEGGPRCGEEATRRRLLVARTEGALDLLQGAFGAGRTRVYEDTWGDCVHCEIHHALARQEAIVHVTEHEAERVAFERDHERALQRFERVGLAERVRDHMRIEDERFRAPVATSPTSKRRSRQKATVVPFETAKRKVGRA